MVKYHPMRDIIRQLNTKYFHDKRIALDISLFILGPAGVPVFLLVDRMDRAGNMNMTIEFVEMNEEYLGKKRYYNRYILQYGDYYSVQADDACEIEFWRETERAEQ